MLTLTGILTVSENITRFAMIWPSHLACLLLESLSIWTFAVTQISIYACAKLLVTPTHTDATQITTESKLDFFHENLRTVR